MRKLSIIITALLFTLQLFSQNPSWKTLPNAPNLDTLSPRRFDDVYFINAFTGWIVKGKRYYVNNDTGAVYKTTNGGYNWLLTNNTIQI
jgi:photosystem II stability/assembly factor-like uncharacterized protein